ncbi:MAG: 3-dehydroquinate synthase family protein [Planctomycetota bacterium]
MPPRRVEVATPQARYDVLIGHGLLDELGTLAHERLGPLRAACVFEDLGVPAGLRDAAAESLGGAAVGRYDFALDERSKSIETWSAMLAALAERRIERAGDAVFAIGGGILGDVAGFAAAAYRRGVPIVQCPTTLLAMVDASVGGKTGVNLRHATDGGETLLKNFVGAFHQPALVVADVDALRSLGDRDLACGLAECIKHTLIAPATDGPASLGWLLDHADEIRGRSPAVLADLVSAHVSIKARVVAGDERERATGNEPGRRALNLGHTFAHAIEALDAVRVDGDGGRDHPRHGEAVGLGLIAATRLAEILDAAPPQRREEVEHALRSVGLPTRLAEAPSADALIDAMHQDKKAAGGVLRLVVPTAGGVRIADAPPADALERAWAAVIP